MAKRKIVFVIVEGPSDDEALGVLLSKIYDKDSVYVHIMHGDITTQAGVNSSNIVSKIGNCVRQYAAQNHYKQADFKEIIHIVDMDGAYAPDSTVIEDAEAVKPVYSVTEIRSLSIFKESLLGEMLSGFNADSNQDMNLGELETTVQGPALLIIPIAIYL